MDNKKIGKINLDYTHYSGEDLYCDGDVEQELLKIAKSSAEAEFPGIIEEKAQWPYLYHLSPLRENIIEWLPLPKDAKVLEIGSGCGAITGALSKKAGSVDCVDLSNQRSLINAYRHEYCENITIHVGNFKDIEPDLPKDYNLICLIGVFEYGEAYIGGRDPFGSFLNIIKRHLKAGGNIAIAIENRMGLKYFAGCREDHSGKLFSGIEGYPGENPARTFTKRGLLEIAEKCGFSSDECHMYYPYPDYKFMNTLFSDERLPQEGELKDNLRNFDRGRLKLFDEKLAFENILKEGEFPLFSNSYMLILGKKPDVVYARYSNDRLPERCIVTEKIVLSNSEMLDNGASACDFMVKRPLFAEGIPHIKMMAENYSRLEKRYAGSRLDICPCELSGDGTQLSFPNIPGKRLEELLDELAFAGDNEGFLKLFEEYVERISYGEEKGVTDLDLIFSNILVDGDKWTVIDYEWVLDERRDSREIAFRAMYCYLMENPARECINVGIIYDCLDIKPAQADEFRHRESLFQKKVTGNHKSLAEIRDLIANPVVDIKSLEGGNAGSVISRLQVYENTGNGFNEKESYLAVMSEEGYRVNFGDNVKELRLDPCNFPCICHLKKLTLDGIGIDTESREFDSNGSLIGKDTYAFRTDDPGFVLNLEGEKLKKENILIAEFDICKLPEEISSQLPESGYRQSFKQKLKGLVRKK